MYRARVALIIVISFADCQLRDTFGGGKISLHCYFAIELKTGDFQPEYAGKLSFYISAIDGTMRTPVDGPTIGLLLCESRSGPIVEYALQNLVQPIGVSTCRVTRELPEPVREELPSVEDLQDVVKKLHSEIETLRTEQSGEEQRDADLRTTRFDRTRSIVQ